jgi:hypothetical protein
VSYNIIIVIGLTVAVKKNIFIEKEFINDLFCVNMYLSWRFMYEERLEDCSGFMSEVKVENAFGEKNN